MGKLIRALPKGFNFRTFAVECRDVVETARVLQNLSPVATAALGRALAGVALLSADLKFGKVLLQIKGDGPIGEILAEGDHEGRLRGTVHNPHVFLEPENKKLPVGKAVGKNGFISVVKDLGLKEIYQSSAELISGEIAEDLAYYLTVSEQIPSVVALGVLVDRDGSVLQAGGYMIQKLPQAKEEEIVFVEERLKATPPTTELLSKGLSPEGILSFIFGEVEVLEEREVVFRCTCSLERVKNALIALGKKEIEEMVAKGEPVEVTCHFCRATYKLSIDDLKELLGTISEG
jgi:molecular chaperone Hsp33